MIFRAETKQAQAELAKLRTDLTVMNQVGSIVVSGAKQQLTAIGKAGLAAFAGVTVATAASIAAVKDFDKNLTHAKAIAQLTESQMNDLGESLNTLSVAFGQNATDMASGAVELTKAGLSMTEMQMVMDDITMAMMANSISFEVAAQTGIFAVKQFGDAFSDMPGMFDIIQKVTQETIMDFDDMQQALQYAGSTAQLTGVSFEELMAMMGTLSQRAMEMGIASRSVNQFMMNLMKRTDEMQVWIDEMGLGVEVIKDGALNVSALIDAFSELDMTMEQLQKSSEIFTVRAMRSWGLLVTGAEEYRKILMEDIPNAQGTLAGVAEVQRDTIAFQMSQLREILLSPLRSPEFIGEIVDLLKDLKEPVAEISQILAKGLYAFLQFTVDNKDLIIGLFKESLEIAINFIVPLYNLGKIILKLVAGHMEWIVLWKVLQSLNVPMYIAQTTKAMITLRKARAANIRMIGIQSQMVANLTMSFIGGAGAAFFMGQAFGEAARMGNILLGVLTAIQTTIAAGMLLPPGFKLLAPLIGIGAGALQIGVGEYGISKHEPVKEPDFSSFEDVMAGVEYEPTTNSTYGSGANSGSGTTVNVYADNIYGYDDFTEAVNTASNRTEGGFA